MLEGEDECAALGTGRFWVVTQVVSKCLELNEQLVVFSEHLANLEAVAQILRKVCGP